jgi:hypothetical protein
MIAENMTNLNFTVNSFIFLYLIKRLTITELKEYTLMTLNTLYAVYSPFLKVTLFKLKEPLKCLKA